MDVKDRLHRIYEMLMMKDSISIQGNSTPTITESLGLSDSFTVNKHTQYRLISRVYPKYAIIDKIQPEYRIISRVYPKYRIDERIVGG